MQENHRGKPTRGLISPKHVCAVFVVIVLSGCAGLSEIQDSVSHLDQGAHAASVAEASFLATVQTTECDSQFFTSAYSFSTDKAPNFQLANYCHPNILTSDQIKLRNSMMDALVLYADKMLALASSGDNKQLGTDAQTLATNLKSAAKNGGVKLSKSSPAIVAGVEAAFVAIAEMALDEKKYKGIVDAAKNMQTPINDIVLALTTENYAFAQAIIGDHQVLEGQLREEVAYARCEPSPSESDNKPRGDRMGNQKSWAQQSTECKATPAVSTNTFLTILRAREILASATGSTNQQMATTDWSNIDMSKPLNDALPALAKANQAIASGASGGVYAAAHDLYTRSVAAKDQYGAMVK
jgi:hypothetical protein